MIDVHELSPRCRWCIVAYVLVTAISNLQVLSPWMLVFPIYASSSPHDASDRRRPLRRARVSPRDLGRYGFGYRRGPAAERSLQPTIAGCVDIGETFEYLCKRILQTTQGEEEC